MTIVLTTDRRDSQENDSEWKPCIPSSKDQTQWFALEVDDRTEPAEVLRVKRHGRQIM